MRFARSLLLGVVGLGLAACADADLGPTTAKIPPLAFVRYVNAMPDTLNTTVRWIDEVEFTPQTFTNVAYRAEGLGSFQGLKAGSRSLRVFTFQQSTNNFPVDGNTTILVDTTHNFEAGKYYTMIHAGSARAGTQRLVIVEDAPPASPSTGTLLRVYNLSYALTWDLYLGTTATAVADTGTGLGTNYTAAQLGTLVASGAPGTVETVVLPYAARATGNFGARLVAQGTTASLHTRVNGPSGVAETASLEAAGGTNVAGSVLSIFVFDRKTAGSPASTGANARPSVLWTVDRSPARTIAP